MRSASICVLPDPAPASRRMFVSSSSRIIRRESRSMARESDMRDKPPVDVELGIRQLLSRLPIHFSAASRDVVTEPAVIHVRCPDKLSREDQVSQVTKHRRDVNVRRGRDDDALLASLVTREVINAGDDLWILVAGL